MIVMKAEEFRMMREKTEYLTTKPQVYFWRTAAGSKVDLINESEGKMNRFKAT